MYASSMAAVTQPQAQSQSQSQSRVHQPRPRLPSHGHNHNHTHRQSHSTSRSHNHNHSHNNHHPSMYAQPMMSQSHVHLPPPLPRPSQPHPLHPASFSSSSYAPYPAAYPSYDASTHAMLVYPPFTASFPSSVPSVFSAPLAVPQPQHQHQSQLSHPLPLPQQQQQRQQSMLQQGLSHQHLALLMQHAWLQQQQQQQQPQQQAYPPSTSVYSSHSVCFPTTSYPLPYPVSLPSLSSVPLLTHAHMHAPMDSSWIYAHTSPSDSSSNISSASSSRTCSPTYHLPCTGCDGVCTCSHLLAPISMSHSHSHSQPPSCTSQASIGTSIESPEPPRSYSPPALMLPPILIPPQPRSVHSAVIHRSAGSGSDVDEDEDEDESSDGDSDSSSTDDNVAQALASTHLSEIPPLTLTSSTSTTSNASNSSFSGSIRNNFETPLMIIDDEDSELVHVISPSSICASTPSNTRRVAPTRMRSMTVMGMLMAASQRQATTPHPARPQRLSQRMSILRPMAMSTPVSPVDHTRDRDHDHVDDVQSSTIPTVPVSTSFEAPTSLSMSLSPLHPLEWPISSSDVDDKCDDEYACDDEYDKCTRDFSMPSRVTYQLPIKQDDVVKTKPFSYADVVRAKQTQPQPPRDRASSTSHSHSHVIHQVTRVPHVATRA